MDLTLIETMPLGDVEGTARTSTCRFPWCARGSWNAHAGRHPLSHRRPRALCARCAETGGRLGLITPLTHNFCEACNRVRLTCTGMLYRCLGQNDAADLRAPLRASTADDLLNAAIDGAIARKPKGHDFVIDRHAQKPALARHMSLTGG